MVIESAESPAADNAGTARAVAFFDVDNTLVHGSSLFMFGRGAVREGFIRFRDLWQFAYKQFRFKRVGENIKHVKSLQSQALRLIAGRSAEDLETAATDICAHYVVPRIWPEALLLIAKEKEEGKDVWLLTATPIQIAREIARAVGATGALGTISEQVDGKFTGELVGPVLHAEEKTVAAKALASERGYDLAASSAYSDSSNDVTLLELVGHPVATNPDNKLAAIAAERGWSVIRFPRSLRRSRKGNQASTTAEG